MAQLGSSPTRELTLFLGELVQQARLAHAHIAYDDVFKDVRIVVWGRDHGDDDGVLRSRGLFVLQLRRTNRLSLFSTVTKSKLHEKKATNIYLRFVSDRDSEYKVPVLS